MEYDLRHHTLIYALRYSLPRNTGAFLQVQSYIKSIAHELTLESKVNIIDTLYTEEYEAEHEILRQDLLYVLAS